MDARRDDARLVGTSNPSCGPVSKNLLNQSSHLEYLLIAQVRCKTNPNHPAVHRPDLGQAINQPVTSQDRPQARCRVLGHSRCLGCWRGL